MRTARSTNLSELSLFFILTFVLSLPLYIANVLAFHSAANPTEWGGVLITLLTVTPITSTYALTYYTHHDHGAEFKALLRRCFDRTAIPRLWWTHAIILFLPPLLFATSLAVFRCIIAYSSPIDGSIDETTSPIPPPLAPLVTLPAAFCFLVLLATCEEMGWMGYAFQRMISLVRGDGDGRGGSHASPSSRTALKQGLKLGLVWAAWHAPFFIFLFPGRVVPQLLLLLATRMIMVCIYSTWTDASVLSSILYHASDNTALTLFPDIMSTRVGAVIHCTVVTVAAVVVVVLSGGIRRQKAPIESTANKKQI